MIMHLLTNIPYVSKLYIIYHQNRHYRDNGNLYLYKFSPNYHNERYSDVVPVEKNTHYHIARLLLSPKGDWLFKNYSSLNYAIHLYHLEDDSYITYYDALPLTYKWLFTKEVS